MDYSHYKHLIIDIDDGLAKVTINRPEVYNAVNHVLHRELGDIWRDLDRDPDVRAIVVTGAGDKAFSAGGDLSMLEQRMELPAEERFDDITNNDARDLVYNMVNCDKVIIAAINGVAVGAGLAVAMMSASLWHSMAPPTWSWEDTPWAPAPAMTSSPPNSISPPEPSSGPA